MVARLKIQIGAATLYLGDCEQYLQEIGRVDALVMDPQYDFKTSGGGRLRKKRPNMDKIAAAGLDKGFDPAIFDLTLYGSVVTFCHNDQLPKILTWLAAHYPRFVLCGWRKTNPMPVANKHYQPEIEPYIHAWQLPFHPTGDLADKKRIIDAPVGKSPYEHPTVKPDAVMNKILKNVSGQTVLDPYAGTGSTGIAAIRAGKRFIGIEKNPDFFLIMCQRFFALYGGEMAGPVVRG